VTRLRAFWKDADLQEIADAILPEWIRPKTYIEIRRSVLDRPRQAVAKRRKYVHRYAVFCATAPYAFVASLLWLADFSRALPPDPLEQHLATIRTLEKELIEISTEGRLDCEAIEQVNRSQGKRCAQLNIRTVNSLQGELDEAQEEIQAYVVLRAAVTNVMVAALMFLLNAIVFARVWLRFYPARLEVTGSDRKRITRAYLLVMSTTMFIPNCIGAFVFAGINLLSRYDLFAAQSISGWLLMTGLLPFVACGVLGSYRINDVLLNTSSWRVGKTWAIFLISNSITMIFASVLLLVLIAILFLR
jgi:hypothetical protein